MGQAAIIRFLGESQAELYYCFYTKPRTRLFSPPSSSLPSLLDWIDPGKGKKKWFCCADIFSAGVSSVEAVYSDPGASC